MTSWVHRSVLAAAAISLSLLLVMIGRTGTVEPGATDSSSPEWATLLAANGPDHPFFGGLDYVCLAAFENNIPAGSTCEGPGGNGICVCGFCVPANAYPIMYQRANCRVISPGQLYCDCANRPVKLDIVF